MSELIEWESYGNRITEINGYVGDEAFFRIRKGNFELEAVFRANHEPSIKGDYAKRWHKCESLEAAKAKAEELFQSWLKSAKLIPEPVRCDKCGDSGSVRTKHMNICRYMKNIKNKCSCGANEMCPCTTNPHSLYNLTHKKK